MSSHSLTSNKRANWQARDWAHIQEGQLAAIYHTVLGHPKLRTGVRHLDIGCGAGMAATLSTSLGSTVTGLDPSPEMLDIARSRVPKGAFYHGVTETLPFDDNSFDLTTAFNVFAFSEDPVQAMGEVARVTMQDGRVAITVWGDPEKMEATSLLTSAAQLLSSPSPYDHGPFSLSAGNELRDTAVEAGLKPIEVFDIQTAWGYPDEETALRGLASSGIAGLAIEQSGEEAFIRVTKTALTPYLQPNGSYRISAIVRCLIATT